MIILLINQIIGNVKLIAASGISPSLEIKNRSTTSKEMIAKRPIAIGIAWRRKCAGTGPVVRSADKSNASKEKLTSKGQQTLILPDSYAEGAAN